MKWSYLVKGIPGHPLHPPLTDLTIGTYSFATIAAVLDKVGIVERNAAYAWWIALVVGLCATVLTATTGFFDWLEITWGSELWKTATAHLTAMVSATALFLTAALAGHHGYTQHTVTTWPFVLTLIGFALLTTGGWLGGAVVFVHGMRCSAWSRSGSRRLLRPSRPTLTKRLSHNEACVARPLSAVRGDVLGRAHMPCIWALPASLPRRRRSHPDRRTSLCESL